MKKIAFLLALAILLATVPAVVLAGGPDKGAKGIKGQAGRSNVGFVELWEKNPDTWEIVEDGAWAKLKYNLEGETFDFVFNGHGLEANTEYSLIYYADFEDRMNVWGGNNPGALIASGTSNGGGNIHLMGPVELNMDLPCSPDANIDIHDYSGPPDNYVNAHGAKIWLVPSDCLTGSTDLPVVIWAPTRFLFETDLIWYDDTDV